VIFISHQHADGPSKLNLLLLLPLPFILPWGFEIQKYPPEIFLAVLGAG
jgi:hypothetical protein